MVGKIENEERELREEELRQLQYELHSLQRRQAELISDTYPVAA
jgi:hypothetical protein